MTQTQKHANFVSIPLSNVAPCIKDQGGVVECRPGLHLLIRLENARWKAILRYIWTRDYYFQSFFYYLGLVLSEIKGQNSQDCLKNLAARELVYDINLWTLVNIIDNKTITNTLNKPLLIIIIVNGRVVFGFLIRTLHDG